MERLEKVREKGLNEREWRRYYYKHQQEYKRRKLNAVKAAVGEGSFRSIARELSCSTTSLGNWLDCYLQEGLAGLVKDIHHQKPERLSSQQREQLQDWLTNKQPVDLGMEGYLWTAKVIAALVKKEFEVEYQPQGIYKLLYRMGFSHQRAHRDYGNASKEDQQQFIEVLKKTS